MNVNSDDRWVVVARVESCVFMGNRNSIEELDELGGSVVVQQGEDATNNSLTVSLCVFERNSYLGWPGGAGVVVKAAGKASFSTVVLESSRFLLQAAGGDGGALMITYHGQVDHVTHAVRNCTFERCTAAGGGAAVSLRHEQGGAHSVSSVWDCTFHGGEARGLSKGGGGIATNIIQPLAYSSLSVSVCMFEGNSASGSDGGGGAGGALWVGVPMVVFTTDPLEQSVCAAEEACNTPLWDYASVFHVALSNCALHKNRAMSYVGTRGGGAVYGLHAWFSINNCTFQDNHANNTGGALRLTGRSRLNVTASAFIGNSAGAGGGTVFLNTLAPVHVNTDTHIYLNGVNAQQESQANVLLSLNTLDWWVVNAGYQVFDGVLFQCPRGMQLTAILSPASGNDEYASIPRTTSRFGCVPCPSFLYSMGRVTRYAGGEERYSDYHNGEYWQNNHTQSDITCFTCPYGADCGKGGASVMVLSGFWAIISPRDTEKIAVSRCPKGYCKKSPHAFDDSCVVGRGGVLCGECMPGYSQALDSPQCMPEHQCTSGGWYFPVWILLLLAYVLYFLLTSYQNSDGLITVTVFYMQVVGLMLSSQDADQYAALLGLFSLRIQTSSDSSSLCPVPGLSTLGGMAWGYMAPPVCICLLLLLRFGVFANSDKARAWLRQRLERATTVTATTVRVSVSTTWLGHVVKEEQDVACWAAAYARLFMFTYTSTLSTTLVLLHCVPVEGVEGQRLFLAASVQCYTSWQVVLFVVLVALALVPVGVGWYTWRSRMTSERQRTGAIEGIQIVLSSPFKPQNRWWQGVLLAELLCFSLIDCLEFDEARQSLLFFGTSMVSLLLHTFTRPFNTREVNALQSLCLVCWCVMSNALTGDAYLTSAAVPRSAREHVPSLESLRGLCIFVPIAAAAVLLLYTRVWKPKHQQPSVEEDEWDTKGAILLEDSEM